jgi:hypothetical protein
MPHSINADYNHSANASNPPQTQPVTVMAYSNASFTLSPSEYPDSSRLELDDAHFLVEGSILAKGDTLEEDVLDACQRYLKDHPDFTTEVKRLDSFIEHNGKNQRRVVVCGDPKACQIQSDKHRMKHTSRLLAMTNWVPEQDYDSIVTLSDSNSRVTKPNLPNSHLSASSLNSRPQVRMEKPVDCRTQTKADILAKQFDSLVDDGAQRVTYSPCGTYISWRSPGGMGRFVGKDPRNGHFGTWTMD